MKHSKSGGRKLNNGTISEQVEAFKKVLNDYIGAIKLKVDLPDLERYMELTADELRSITAEDCQVGSYTLLRYSLFIQKEFNRHQNLQNWAEHNLDLMLAKESDNYGDKYTKWDAKRAMLENENNAAKELANIIKHARSRCTELTFITNQINLMAKTLDNLQYSKRKSENSHA